MEGTGAVHWVKIQNIIIAQPKIWLQNKTRQAGSSHYIHLIDVQSTNGIYVYYIFLIPSW